MVRWELKDNIKLKCRKGFDMGWFLLVQDKIQEQSSLLV
jgi:hypothetical protein